MKRILSILLVLLTLLTCSVNVLATSPSVPDEELDTESAIYKKCVLFVGDSICEASNEWGTDTVGWAGRIMNWNKMTGLNKGKSGASISTCRGDNTVIAQLKGQLKNKDRFDYVIMHGGVNDAWDSAPVGEMTEGFDAKFDTSTFAGGLEATFKYAKETFTNAYFGYIINFQLPSAKYGRLSDMSEYFEMAKKICDKWEIPYLDLYFDEDFNRNVMKTPTLKYLKDYIHPNPDGYDVVSPYINDWMKTLEAEAKAKEESVAPVESVPEEVSVALAPANEAKGINADIIVYIVCGVITVAALLFAIIAFRKKK